VNTRELDQLTNEGAREVCQYLLDKIATKVVQLQAIVDKLPKCWRLNESGKRVQDVPVVPGMDVWVPDIVLGAATARQVLVVSVHSSGRLECTFHGARDGPFAADLVSFTREAAEAARKEPTP
jgi:hypothetical protein